MRTLAYAFSITVTSSVLAGGALAPNLHSPLDSSPLDVIRRSDAPDERSHDELTRVASMVREGTRADVRGYPLIVDAFAREFSLFVGDTTPPLITDAAAHEFSVFVGNVDPRPVTDASAREFSAFVMIPLELGVPYEGDLSVRQQLYFRLTTPPNHTLLITLDHESPTAWTQLLASFGTAPDDASAEFVYSNPSQPDQRLVIPNTQDGTYIVLARSTNEADASATTSFTILAESVPFDLRFAEPDVMGAGVATLEIHGARFTPATTFQLRNPNTDAVFPATSVEFVDAATALAAFDMTGAELAPYDLIADDPGLPTATLYQGVEVVPASPHFSPGG